MDIRSPPRRRAWRTYSFRITLLYFIVVGAFLAVLFSTIYFATASFMQKQLRSVISVEEEVIGDTFIASGAGVATVIVIKRSRPAGHTPNYYLLQDPDGHVAAGNLPAMVPATGWLELPIPPRLDPGEINTTNESDTLIARGKVLPGGWLLVVGKDIDRFTNYEDLILRTVGWSAGAILIVMLLGGRTISNAMLGRMSAIADASEEIVSGNLRRRIALRGTGDEFDHLSASLNSMLDRIAALMDELRQVSNDIAHDLRTPLTRLRQRLEGARESAQSMQDYRAAVGSAIVEVDGILSTFGALLRIAQIESGAKRSEFTEIDLSELARTIVDTYSPVAEDDQHPFKSDVDTGVRTKGDRRLLTQMLANVLENAIRHTPAGTQIGLTLASTPQGPLCRVWDCGPGVPKHEMPKIFRRFYRLDSSRSTPGSGLGLSLVSAIAELHRIAVDLEDGQPGLVVTFRFPG